MPTTTEAQERALRELVAPAGRSLCHRGYEVTDIVDRERTTTVTAWVTSDNGLGIGKFSISPDGAVTGVFEAAHEQPIITR